jgi:very-short-patch-repair endonuclease
MFGRRLVTPHQAQVLAKRARFMRFSPTRGEEWLWRELSGSKTGFAFRRQLVIGNRIVDFACTKVRLVVEVDGSAHERREHLDAARDRALRALGWHVLRVAEDDVVSDLHVVVPRILLAAAALARVTG